MSQETFMPVKVQAGKFPSWVYSADYRIVTPDNLVEAMEQVVGAQVVAWDTEFERTSAGQILHGLNFSVKEGTGWFLPVRMDHMENLPLDIARRVIQAITHPSKRNVAQTCRSEMRTVKYEWPDRPELQNVTDDIAVLWYQKDPNEAKDFREARPRKGGLPGGFSLEAMMNKYLKIEIPSLGDFFKDGGLFRQLDAETARLYGCCDADSTLRLYNFGMTPDHERSFIWNLDMSVIPALMDMEDAGLWYDESLQHEVEAEARKEVARCRAEAYRLLKTTPDAVNIDSPAQLSDHVHNTLSWPPVGRKGKGGRYSINKQAREKWSGSADPDVALASDALNTYSKIKTLHNNFLTKLHTYVNPHTNAIHCSLLSTVVPTGRLACAGPNLQQIPKHTNIPVRRAFKARPGKIFAEIDYSQIELRVFAGETKDSFFYDAFLNNVDLHLKTASVIFREKITSKKDPRRNMGKTMNFGPIYGMKPEGLAARTDYDIYEAERILDDFWSAMPDAKAWVDKVHAEAKLRGGVSTHFGRWRPLSSFLNSRFRGEVEFGQRSAVNTIVQGTAADIMRIAIVRLHRALPTSGFDARMVLTIHDSVLFEIAEDTDLAAFLAFAREQMCTKIDEVLPDYPPLDIDMSIGRNWYDMEEWEPNTKIEAETVQPTRKNIPLPELPASVMSEFIALATSLKDKNGEVDVYLTRPNTEPVGPLPTTAAGYQQLLKFLVSTAQAPENKTEELNVSFA